MGFYIQILKNICYICYRICYSRYLWAAIFELIFQCITCIKLYIFACSLSIFFLVVPTNYFKYNGLKQNKSFCQVRSLALCGRNFSQGTAKIKFSEFQWRNRLVCGTYTIKFSPRCQFSSGAKGPFPNSLVIGRIQFFVVRSEVSISLLSVSQCLLFAPRVPTLLSPWLPPSSSQQWLMYQSL